MLYLFDANVLITASNTYYPLDQIPEFWGWIEHQARTGNIKLPIEIIEEVLDGSKEGDLLLPWIKANKAVLTLDEAADVALVRTVVDKGYAADLKDDELEEIGRDPFIVAYALAKPERCVVTTETSKPKKQRQNRKIPDVCGILGVACFDPFKVYRTLGFSTNWNQLLYQRGGAAGEIED